MSLSELTSPTAVRLAVGECKRIGREKFLNFYGFRPSREYPLLYEGGEYDSKAIAGVAHGYQFPSSVPSNQICFQVVSVRAGQPWVYPGQMFGPK